MPAVLDVCTKFLGHNVILMLTHRRVKCQNIRSSELCTFDLGHSCTWFPLKCRICKFAHATHDLYNAGPTSNCTTSALTCVITRTHFASQSMHVPKSLFQASPQSISYNPSISHVKMSTRYHFVDPSICKFPNSMR